MNQTTTTGEKARSILEKLIGSFVRHPKDLVVHAHELTASTTIEVETGRADIGKVIGEKGKHARSVRAIMEAMGRKYDTEIRVLFNEPTKGSPEPQTHFRAKEWSRTHDKEIADLLEEVASVIFRGPISVKYVPTSTTTTCELSLFDGRDLAEQEAATALNTLFHAIGKAKGRTVFVDVVQGRE